MSVVLAITMVLAFSVKMFCNLRWVKTTRFCQDFLGHYQVSQILVGSKQLYYDKLHRFCDWQSYLEC